MRLRITFGLLSFAFLSTLLQGDDQSPTKHDMGAFELFSIDKTTWKNGPPSLPKGAQIAVLEGDPTKEGPFVFRVKVPDGYRIPPHTHPKTERGFWFQLWSLNAHISLHDGRVVWSQYSRGGVNIDFGRITFEMPSSTPVDTTSMWQLNFTEWMVPHWSLVIPLTLLSAYLILWQPRKRPPNASKPHA